MVIVETAHGGAYNDRTNITISVPIGSVYVNEEALGAVSTLYLLGPKRATCSPFKAKDGTLGLHGPVPGFVLRVSRIIELHVVHGSTQNWDVRRALGHAYHGIILLLLQVSGAHNNTWESAPTRLV
ncbi:hypothetical protein F4679DRAFT_588489 [Xylaria curta]|nr:hypothetical protein F4679DRAFT_588489 [Xylaria curta]